MANEHTKEKHTQRESRHRDWFSVRVLTNRVIKTETKTDSERKNTHYIYYPTYMRINIKSIVRHSYNKVKHY